MTTSPTPKGARYPIVSYFRYGIGIALGAVALLVGALVPTDWAFKVAITAFYTVLVLVSAALGGVGPGIVCTVLCAAAVAYWVEPAGSFRVDAGGEVFGIGLFVLSGLLVSAISERMHHAMRGERAGRRIAEQKAAAEQEARAAVERALEATRAAEGARDEMLALVAHDLQDPLGVIDLSAGLIERVASPDEEIRRRTAILHRTVGRMSRLVDNLLESSNTLEAAGPFLELADVAVEPLFAEAVEEHEPEAQAKGVELNYEVASDLPPVRCAHDRIVQVISNLVANALRFTPRGGRIRLTADCMDGAVQLQVHDTGAGISAELLPHIFERYSRERREAGGRTGLGLSTARAIIERHGGTIRVESTEGAGSIFSFTLPVAASETRAGIQSTRSAA